MSDDIKKTADDFNTFVRNASPKELTDHIQTCMEAFCRGLVPTAAMVEEVVMLSLAMSNNHQFLLIVNSYLQKLNLLEVKAGYHLSGYARILIHSLAAQEPLGLNRSDLEQVSCAFIKLWSGVCLENQTESDIDDGLSSLGELLLALERSKTVLSSHWLSRQGSVEEGALNKLVKAYKKSINLRNHGSEAQAWSLALIKQVMTRLTARSKGESLVESGSHLGSAAGCVFSALGSGLSGAGTPFFIGTVGAIPSLVKALIHVGQALGPLARCAKTSFDKRAWYSQLGTLRELLLLTSWQSMQGGSPVEGAPSLSEVLVTLFSNQDFWKCWPVQTGVCDTLIAVLHGTRYRGGELAGLDIARMTGVQSVALAGLVHIFRQSSRPEVRALVLKQLLDLQSTEASLSGVLSTAIGMLLAQERIELVALNQGETKFMSKRQLLTSELAEGDISVVTLMLVQLSLQQGEEASKLLVQQLSDLVLHKRRKDQQRVPLVATQALLHIHEQHPCLSIEPGLQSKLGDKYSKYLEDGSVYERNQGLMQWMTQIWELVPSEAPFDGAELVVAEQILPLWTLCESKPQGEKITEYITNRYTLVRVGRDGIVSDAKTEELMNLTGMLAKIMRELNRDIPPSGGTSTKVEHDYIAMDVVDGGAVHITGDDFFIKAAAGLSSLVKALAPDEVMQDVLEEPIIPAKEDLQLNSPRSEASPLVEKIHGTFFGKDSTKNSAEKDSIKKSLVISTEGASLGKQ